MGQIIRRLGIVLAVGLISLALAACSGGGSGGSDFNAPAGMTTATISGTVTGTAFVAVDAASGAEVGRIVASATATGGEKSFSLPLPPGRTYRFYLVENEGSADARLFPLYQGTANRFSVSAVTSIDLGFVDTVSGIAVPSKDMTKVPGVAAAGEDASIPPQFSSSAFSPADLQGSWHILQMVGGANPRWVRGTLDIDASGKAPAAPYLSSTGSGTFPETTFSITPGGVVTFPSSITGGFQGVMTKDKGMIAGTYTFGAGDYAIALMVRSVGSYAQSDLQGNWSQNRLLSGAVQGWSRGSVAIDANGNASITSVVTNSGNGADSSTKLLLDAAGVVTEPANASSYGVISPDKSQLTIVSTDVSGAATMTVLTRTGDTTFSGSDFLGTWRTNWLTAGNSSSWGRSLFISNPAGDSVFRSIILSYGRSADSAVEMGFFASGNTNIENTDFGGILSGGKNVMVGTKTDGAGFSLYLFVK